MIFSQLSEKEFNEFEINHPYGSFMQSIEAYRLKKKDGYECYLLGVKDDDKVIAATYVFATPVAKIFKYFYAPRGFLIDYNQKEVLDFFIKNIVQFLYKKKGLYLKFDPYVPYIQRDADANIVKDGFNNQYIVDELKNLGSYHAGFTTGVNKISQVRWMMTLDLKNKSKENILKDMRSLTRRSIKKTENFGIQVRELNLDEIDVFIDMLKSTGKRCNFDIREREYYLEQVQAFGKYSKILVAYMDVDKYIDNITKDKEIATKKFIDVVERLKENPENKKNLNKKESYEKAVMVAERKLSEAFDLKENYGNIINMAASLFINQGNEYVYIAGATYEEFIKYDAQYAIQWHMIQECIQNHVPRYNFYGQTGDFSKSSVDYGVYEFKKGFGGIVEELIGEFILPIHKTWFHLYNSIKHII